MYLKLSEPAFYYKYTVYLILIADYYFLLLSSKTAKTTTKSYNYVSLTHELFVFVESAFSVPLREALKILFSRSLHLWSPV